MAAEYTYPFGQPVTARPPSATSSQPVFVLGAYPSALHVSWRPEGGRLVRAIPVADEPEPFWNGDDAEDRLRAWKAALHDPDSFGEFAVPPALNGPSGGWVDTKVLAP